ncbi:DUF5990 family protein [Haloechinothrix salitolerans]|uniref:DUF5990 family protein n=1 Tax=Haloechinothrix salitolerans TaxID=926830 RepID=A0ABW2C3M9_9PSEU
MLLEIRGQHFPGRSWHIDGEPCDNVHVGVQLGREPSDLVPGDSPGTVWTVEIDVVQGDEGIDFRGPAVQGRRHDRFVYLTWGNLNTDGSFTMFRRAKLMLADLNPLVHPTHSEQRIIATVDLTDERGGPRCARLRQPALILAAG